MIGEDRLTDADALAAFEILHSKTIKQSVNNFLYVTGYLKYKWEHEARRKIKKEEKAKNENRR